MLRILSLLFIVFVLANCNHQQPTVKGRSSTRILLVRDITADEQPTGEAITKVLDTITPDGWQLETVYNYDLINEDSIHHFSAILLADVQEEKLTIDQRTSIQRYAEAGGGLLIADPDTMRPFEWNWYQSIRNEPTDNVVIWQDGDLIEPIQLIGSNTFDLNQCTTPPAPRDEQFNLEVLDDQIYEPMQLEILPFGEVLFLERRGLMKLYDPAKDATEIVHDFNVCIEGNYEDGLHGVALDPDYGKSNHWLYLYYTPAPCDSLDQLLSRFDFKNGILDTASEKIVLRVTVQRDKCCHSGGAVEFGADGLLYLSTGDNTSSKESDGYSPIDERPGRGPFDAQKSSSNTHDLRGKILRIKPEKDGSYSIPEGNLFPADGSNGRPEIYTMGCRNPFRIAIDQKTNFVYWGDVGPDVGEAGRYGPNSYDEWNQARTAGNFGWPYFIGDNYAFPERDFATDEVGALYDPERPINNSPNNYGRKELPPAQRPILWYPYGPSLEFPQLGTGSRSAMAGPFYYRNGQVPITTLAFPDYYVGKWFIYEWARSWIKVVTFDDAHEEIVQIEDFLPTKKISKPIDIKFGPNGAMYMLEYGNDYFLNNPDARLVRITYSAGNRPPLAILDTDELAGGVPFETTFSAARSYDPDPLDSLTYQWFVDGKLQSAADPEFTAAFNRPGYFEVSLKVTDQKGVSSEVNRFITIGNSPPVVALKSSANQSFLLPGTTQFDYTLELSDQEDQAKSDLDLQRAMISAAPVQDAAFATALRLGKASLPSGPLEYVAGAKLLENSDCYTCHKENSENVGPAYLAVANRYEDNEKNIKTLAQKVIKGGNGNWGERLMSGHPALAEEDAEMMVSYILSLNDVSRLPTKGSVTLKTDEHTAAFVIAAAYRDGGSATAPSLTRQRSVVLRPNHLEAEDAADELYRAHIPQGGEHHSFNVVTFRPGGYLKMENIDLKKIRRFRMGVHAYSDSRIELHYGTPDGPVLFQTHFPRQEDWLKVDVLSPQLPPSVVDEMGPTDIYIVWLGEDGKAEDDMGHHRPADIGWLDWIEVVQ